MSKVTSTVSGWLTHRNALLALAGTFEEKHLDYRPWEKGMSVSELIMHIAQATHMFVEIVKLGAASSAAKQSPETVSALLDSLKSLTEQTKANMAAITDAQLEQIAAFNGMKMPGSAMLQMAVEHEIHHKGQLFTYARILGIDNVPFFISR